jgi:hypothetical protein
LLLGLLVDPVDAEKIAIPLGLLVDPVALKISFIPGKGVLASIPRVAAAFRPVAAFLMLRTAS